MEVRLEDQQHINQFGRLNVRMHDLEEEIKAKVGEVELLDDASNELILADDDEAIRCAPLLLFFFSPLPFFRLYFSPRRTLNATHPRHTPPTRVMSCGARILADAPTALTHRVRARPPATIFVRSYAFGECYYEVTKDQAEELLEEQKEKKEGEVDKLKQEMRSIQDTLADLKSKLYGRFGKNINLEE